MFLFGLIMTSVGLALTILLVGLYVIESYQKKHPYKIIELLSGDFIIHKLNTKVGAIHRDRYIEASGVGESYQTYKAAFAKTRYLLQEDARIYKVLNGRQVVKTTYVN